MQLGRPCCSPADNFCTGDRRIFHISGNIYISTKYSTSSSRENEVSPHVCFIREAAYFSSILVFSIFLFSFFCFPFFWFFFFANRHLLDASNKNHRTLDSFYRGRCLNVSFICLFARTTLKITPRHGCALLHDDLAGNCATIFSLFSTLGYFLSLSFFLVLFYDFTARTRAFIDGALFHGLLYSPDIGKPRTRPISLYPQHVICRQIEQVELLPVRVKLNELVFRAIFRIIMRSGSNALCNRHLADYPYYEKLVLRVLPKIKFLYK